MRGDISKTEVRILNSTEKSNAEGVVQCDIGEGVGVRAEGNGDCGSGANGERWRSGMDGDKERDACASMIVGVTEEHGKVAM